jgi:hypothetical protein
MTTTATPAQPGVAALPAPSMRWDVDGFVAHLAAGVRFRSGNGAPVTGRETVRTAVADFFTSALPTSPRLEVPAWP